MVLGGIAVLRRLFCPMMQRVATRAEIEPEENLERGEDLRHTCHSPR